MTASLAPDSPAQRKARGAFFTPEAVARYVTQWAVRSIYQHATESRSRELADRLDALVTAHREEAKPAGNGDP